MPTRAIRTGPQDQAPVLKAEDTPRVLGKRLLFAVYRDNDAPTSRIGGRDNFRGGSRLRLSTW